MWQSLQRGGGLEGKVWSNSLPGRVFLLLLPDAGAYGEDIASSENNCMAFRRAKTTMSVKEEAPKMSHSDDEIRVRQCSSCDLEE